MLTILQTTRQSLPLRASRRLPSPGPWPVPAAVRGIIHVPAHNTPIKPDRREALLIAIGKARKWIDDLARGSAASFAVIARREGKVERHVRHVAPLAFLSPRIVSALLDGTAPADLTITKLARAQPYSWAEQEQRVGILPSISR
jgi:site-specific DNA recombinase